MANRVQRLSNQIRALEEVLADLKKQLSEVEDGARSGSALSEAQDERPLALDEYRRYGRQMILPHIGLEGQLRLKKARVLIIGLGGLGCPAATYLAGAGVGTIGLMDGDQVELSNLHRQIAYNMGSVGQDKVDSAHKALQALVYFSITWVVI